MRTLTGKCKDDFELYLKKEMYYLGNESLSDLFWNALIIEFFDSVGIYISIEPQKEFKNIYFDVSVDFELHSVWGNREQATNNAIIKANELYNSKQ